ncbi:hypothetical protein [Escherichia coli]|uniref:hypothetical protein n=1 Tax=Escherichia coli TaxID=562 RepID=UPI001C407B59|nr:hypothetical protein [Escherichia coli]
MTTKTPVVLSDDNSTHLPLGHGNVLPENSIPVSAEHNNTVTTKPDGLFATKPAGMTVANHDYTLSGNGDSSNPLSVRISNLDGNIIIMRQFADDSGGLYLWENEFISSVIHNNSMNGTGGSDDKLGIRISSNTGNSLQLIDNAVSGGGGLYTTQKEDIKYANISLPIICEGEDDLSADFACGKLGNGVYWKKKVILSKAKYGDNDILVYPQLLSLPCKSDGTLVPYQLLINYPLIQPGETPYVYLFLICTEIPTHVISRSTLSVSKIYRGVAISTPTGLDDIYDTANPGHGPYYMLQYMYNA